MVPILSASSCTLLTACLLASHGGAHASHGASGTQVVETCEQLTERADALSLAQFEQGLMFPVTVELSACPLVEARATLAAQTLNAASPHHPCLSLILCLRSRYRGQAWAAGEEWGALLANTSVDGGDIFRIFKRTIDLLRSVSQVPYVSQDVKNTAAAALQAMDRYPLADNVLMGFGGKAAAGGEAEQQA